MWDSLLQSALEQSINRSDQSLGSINRALIM